MRKPIIALDCDGVLLDYHQAYALAWERAFGVFPAERDPKAYWPWDRWKVERLNGAPLSRFRAEFNAQFWTTIPALPDALIACNMLADAGYTPVCVSAIQHQFHEARFKNLQDLGFPICNLYATPVTHKGRNPKAPVLNRIQPEAFVDDYAPYLQGVDVSIYCALIERGLNGSPNVWPDIERVPLSMHFNLLAFAQWWLRRTS